MLRNERLLTALRYFDCPEGELRPMEDAPAGIGWGSITELVDAGMLESGPDASSARKTPFRTTDAGRAVLSARSPASALPRWKASRWEDEPDPGAREAESKESVVAAQSKSERRMPEVRPRGPRKGLIPTQKQILAVYRAAQQAGIHVEMRIEGNVVRFIPCELGDTSIEKCGSSNKGRGFL